MTDKPVTAVSERERARACAIEVLKNCAAHYAKPGWFRSGSEQEFIDMAINNATKLVDAYRREGVREALLRYGQHGASCTATLGQGKPCDCGFTAELEGADQS